MWDILVRGMESDEKALVLGFEAVTGTLITKALAPLLTYSPSPTTLSAAKLSQFHLHCVSRMLSPFPSPCHHLCIGNVSAWTRCPGLSSLPRQLVLTD